jgi:hypothetical protein
MRKDMWKVIVERPRGGGEVSKGRYRNVPLDELPTFEGIRRPHRERKGLNENLSPLRRYLRSQVGRPWDKVYADICENLRPESTVQQHVRDHIEDFVAVRTRLMDGAVFVIDPRGWRGSIRRLDEAFVELYVHSVSGLLLENRSMRRGRRWAYRQAETRRNREIFDRRRDIAPDVQLHKLNGCWYEVRLGLMSRAIECAACPPKRLQPRRGERQANGSVYRYTAYRDEVIDAGLSRMPPEELYGRRGVHAVAKRQLSRKELKAYGLKND